jgi:prevent-host-death family protein
VKRTLSAMEARRKFGEMLEDVRRGDEVIIERAGKVMGVLIPPERYGVIERNREKFWQTVDEIREGFKDMSDEEVERLVDEEVRAVRGKTGPKRRTA